MALKNDLCERLRQLRKELNLTQEAVARQLGIGKSALSMIETGKAILSERNKNTLARSYNLNLGWLEEGTGPMFAATPPVNGEPAEKHAPLQESLKKSVPLFNPTRMDDLSGLFMSPVPATPEDYLYIPNLPECDGAVRINDDGMYPLLRRDDIVLYKTIRETGDSILWDDFYLLLIGTGEQERLMVRMLSLSAEPGYVNLADGRTHMPSIKIARSQIRGLALVRASIRIHSPK